MSQQTEWNPQSYAEKARFVSDLGAPLLELLEPKRGESVLDLGCGDGALTEKIAAAQCRVFGADSSLAQARAARQRGIPTLVADAQHLFLKQRFDAVFTNAALHWMKDAESVVINVARCLKPQGRFVGEFGGRGNVASIRAALHDALRRRGVEPAKVDPWYYPGAEEYSALLAKHGFSVSYIALLPRPTPLPGDILEWLEVFAQPFTKALPEPERGSFASDIRAALEPQLQDSSGTWHADYVRLRFKAVR
jgi:trans-aconitate methyltransferase